MMARSEVDLLIRTRRDLHRHPELGFEEHRTAGIAAERLRAAGYAVQTGVAVTGVVGTLRGGAGKGRTLLLRADMDALPIQEESAHDFVSTRPGLMHACGHDAHVAIGLAVAERLAAARQEWRGTLKYVFQPAEEGRGGARGMIEAGALEGVDAALGLHVWSPLPSGTIAVVPGPFMASAAEFTLTVRGRGGHGASPHEAIDPILVGSHVVAALQSIVARNVHPLRSAVVTVAAFHAGGAFNIIPDTATLRGTGRAFEPALVDELPRRIEAVVRGVCAAFGATYDLEYDLHTPATINDPEMAEVVRRAALEVVGPERVRTDPDVRTLAAEDFSEFLRRVPGCYFFVGCRDEATDARHPHHNPRFDVCEDALPVAVDVLERAALDYLAGASAGGARR